jgi:hypothetical protein
MDKAQTREHLERAEQDVKKGEELIEQHQERLKELASDGDPAEIHEEKLKAVRETEKASEEIRDTIRKEVDEIPRRSEPDKD